MINPKVFEIFHKKSLFQQFTDDQYQTRPLLSLVRMIPNNRILDNLSKFVPDKLKIHVMTSQIGVNYSIKTLMKENIFINQQKINDIVIEFDAVKLTNQSFEFFNMLQLMLEDSGIVGELEFDIFKLKINKLTDHNKKLVNLSDSWYKNQLLQ